MGCRQLNWAQPLHETGLVEPVAALKHAASKHVPSLSCIDRVILTDCADPAMFRVLVSGFRGGFILMDDNEEDAKLHSTVYFFRPQP